MKVSGASADQTNTPPSVSDAAVANCKALETADFSDLQDAPTQIVKATFVDANGKDPAYCLVTGYVAPQVGFELRLPVSNWNGKFMEVGDGGWGGEMFTFLCGGPLHKGYACIASDMGHKAPGALALWNKLQAQVDFGYRATHVTALAGKAIVESYYARAPSESIMFGCSTGGYQGMVEAQRFPWDFNGIVAIAPDIEDEADLGMRIVWHMRNVVDNKGQPIFSQPDLQLLHDAALAKCDMTDGVKDSIVGDPVGCQVDPSVLACKAGQKSGCLSVRQVDAATRIYSGPVTSKGERISTRGMLPGSELEWNYYDSAWAIDLFKYALFTPSPGPGWKITDFDFDRDYKRLGVGALYTDSNPDLRKFKAAGGKLIVAQGGIDTAEIPGAIFDYYETVERTMGGRPATEDFFRLFVVPGMKHCTGGDGAFAIDYLSYLEAWVERGQAPGKMIGAHVDATYLEEHSGVDPRQIDTWVRASRAWTGAFKLKFPLDPDVPVTFTRPFYPYPLLAKYKGSGNPDDAGNFVPVAPPPIARTYQRSP
jgi:feruloyl esterase